MKELQQTLSQIDGKGYKAYKKLQGQSFHFPGFELLFYQVQGDPFAAPSRVAVRVPQKKAAFPKESYQPGIRQVALTDYLTRCFHKSIKNYARGKRGSGKSGAFQIDRPDQEVLERTSVSVNGEIVEARFFAGLPAAGRKVLGREAAEMFLNELPKLVENSLVYNNLPQKELFNHVYTVENQEVMRSLLEEKGLIAFVANGAILPRRSGVDQRPLSANKAIAFETPPELAVELDRPHGGKIRGMGVPKGVNLIVGGGYHGKSTLLRALEQSVYNHKPGDGREGVVAHSTAFKIRAEDGRRVEKVNISPFINNLPFGQDTCEFSSEEASGSTSQAANIIESLEAGANVLLMDEDTSATNFMIRDMRMQRLVAKEKEPITPFIDKVQQLYRDRDISTVVVIGGAGDYFDVADTVLMMETYRPFLVTDQAKEIARLYPNQRVQETGHTFGELQERIPRPGTIDPTRKNKVKVKAQGIEGLQFGYEDIDLHYVEQILDPSQTRAIGEMICYALREKLIDGRRPMKKIIGQINSLIDEKGLEAVSPNPQKPRGDFARPRSLEVAAAINRLRTLKVDFNH
ncbi:MAG: ABC-ATPase domain-containing protein [Bacillota bacterium]